MTTVPTTKHETAPLTQSEVVAAINSTLMDLSAKMAPVKQETATVTLCRLVRVGGSMDYTVLPIEDRSGILVTAPSRPGKLWPSGNLLAPEAALRSFFEQGDVWTNMPDKAVWSVAAKAASNSRLAPNTALTLARAVAAALSIRAGLSTPTANQMV